MKPAFSIWERSVRAGISTPWGRPPACGGLSGRQGTNLNE